MPQDAPKITDPPLADAEEVVRMTLAHRSDNVVEAATAVLEDLRAARYSIIGTHYLDDKDQALAGYRTDTARLRSELGRYKGQAAGLSERCVQLRAQVKALEAKLAVEPMVKLIAELEERIDTLLRQRHAADNRGRIKQEIIDKLTGGMRALLCPAEVAVEEWSSAAADHQPLKPELAPIAPLYAGTGTAGGVGHATASYGDGLDLQAVAVKLNEVIERLNKLQVSRDEEE